MALDWQRKNCAFETIELSGRTGKQLTNTQRVKRILLRMPTIRITKKKKKVTTPFQKTSGTKIISVVRKAKAQHYLILVKNQERFPAGKCSQLRYPAS